MSKTLDQLRTLIVEKEEPDYIKAFLAKGGKITKLPPGKAQGYHGKEDPGTGIKGLAKTKNLNLKKHGKHLDTSTPVHKDDEQKEDMSPLAKRRAQAIMRKKPNPVNITRSGIKKAARDVVKRPFPGEYDYTKKPADRDKPKTEDIIPGIVLRDNRPKHLRGKYVEKIPAGDEKAKEKLRKKGLLIKNPDYKKPKTEGSVLKTLDDISEKNIEFNTGHNINDVEQHAAHKKVIQAIHNAAKGDVTKWKSGYPKGGKMHGMVTAKRKAGVQSVINVIKKHIPKQHHSSIKVYEGHESTTIKSFDEIRKQYSPQTHEWGTDVATRWAKAMTPGELANEGYESEISSHLKALDIDHHWKDGHLHVHKRDHKDVKNRLSDTDMEMPKIKVHEGLIKDPHLRKARELMSPAQNREHGIRLVQKGLKVSKEKATKMHDNVMKAYGFKPENTQVDEGYIQESTNWKGTEHIGLTRYAAQKGYGLQLSQHKRMGNEKFRMGAHISMPMKDVPKLIKALQTVYKAPAGAQLGDAD